MPERVADMWRNMPVKAVANGEPTYERSGALGAQPAGGRATRRGATCARAAPWGWSTARAAYGSGGCVPMSPATRRSSWRRAPGGGRRWISRGSECVGLIGKILSGLPITDMVPAWQAVLAARGLLVSGRLYINYAATGGPLMLEDRITAVAYRVIDPRTGVVVAQGRRDPADIIIPDAGGEPRVFILFDGG